MTDNELKELLARAIIIARDGKRDGERRLQNPIIKKAYLDDAQAVIDALTPMMREFVGSIQDLMPFEIVQGDCFQRTNPHTKLMGNSSMAWAVSNGDRSAHKIRERIFTLSEALASLPDCWRKKGGV